MKMLHKFEKGIHFTANDSIPMLDWDWPNIGHKTEACVTITCLKDVLDRLNEYVKVYPEASIRVYVTPGGVRAFFLDKFVSPEEFYSDIEVESLCADPLYVMLSLKNGNFPVRVSPKLNRPGDFVAAYVCTVGKEPSQEMLDILDSYHDKPIRRFKDTKVKLVDQNW